MRFDIARAFFLKQERETARLQDFLFRHRARTARLLAEWARTKLDDPSALDPLEAAGWTIERDDASIRASLRALIPAGRCSEAEWLQACDVAHAQAWTQLEAELGNPSPHRLS